MSKKWVDTNKYFGPDRRRSGGRRLFERRTLDEAGDIPPLGHILRRLRVHLMSTSQDDRTLIMQMLMGAIREAERLHYYKCADSLKQVDHVLRTGGHGALAEADSRLVEALDHAHFQR